MLASLYTHVHHVNVRLMLAHSHGNKYDRFTWEEVDKLRARVAVGLAMRENMLS